MNDYKPGSFFMTQIGGATGFWIGLGQALAGSPSRYSHAGIVLDTDGTVLEAEPGGARIANLSEYAGRPLLISDAPVQSHLARFYGPESSVRAMVCGQARKLVGTPYSALDYAALALLHLRLPSTWVRNRVLRSGHMICSQLVDAVYASSGLHLYSDGRLPGDVMPADLAAWAEDHA